MAKQTWKLTEGPSVLRKRKVTTFLGLAGGAALLAGVLGASGNGGAATATLLLSIPALLVLAFVIRLDIVPWFYPRSIGQLIVDGTAICDASTGRRIDLREPHELTVVASSRIVRRIKVSQRRGTEHETSLCYDWVAYVLRQGSTVLAIQAADVDADDGRDTKGSARTANRTFEGGAPLRAASPPPGAVHVEMTAFDDVERAILRARSEGRRSR